MNSKSKNEITRRKFVKTAGAAVAGSMIISPAFSNILNEATGKKRVAMVGTGSRGNSFYGKFLKEEYGDIVEFVGLCDINKGRLEYSKKNIGADCPTFTDFDEMLNTVDIDLLMVITVDATHHEFIVKGLNKNIDVVTEKPMTTDEEKCQVILDAQRKSKGKLIMAFNYRYGKVFTKLKEIIETKEIGDLISIDLNWYLNTFHGADYFRRWHGIRDKSGTLLLHKSAHHFDLLNWFIGSDPVEVYANGALEKYGKNNAFRGENCRSCEHTKECEFYWDITKKQKYMDLYVQNEKYDGYLRDNCLWREEIDIFDKMSVLVKYANNVEVTYSLTTYSPFEGFRIAFNGKDGRLETHEGIPWRNTENEDEAKLHEKEMDNSSHTKMEHKFHEIVTQRNFKDYKRIEFPYVRSGHWGGDKLMFDEIFRSKSVNPALNHPANVRDGSLAVLVGIAARKSIDTGMPIKIADLTDLVPQINKWG
ncbi:Gfo/Idh/MocA family oxidoreductase [Lutibacter flavus]|uniref:Tat (Twin-arginine translocation) pathway signal sequence n=1 Tax=Lutibacter flavus TaxID=691689 RepID=A0A238V9Y0_9FLAO|nr:Gfo/Idh/MocA family oxidoreductase [Lutibacter flavus]SNR31018.1 Tat (twin-arginine translocation) pathway signal sequence [Lutibacter flavus]